MKKTEDNSTKTDRIEKILTYVKTHKMLVACLGGLLFGYVGGRLISLIAGSDWHVAVIAGISGGLYIAIICPALVIHTLQIKLTRLKTGKSSWTDYYALSPSMQNLLKTKLIGLGIMLTVFVCLALIFNYQWVVKSLPWH